MKRYFFDFDQKLWIFSSSEFDAFMTELTNNGYSNFEIRDKPVSINVEEDALNIFASYNSDLIKLLRDMGGEWLKERRCWTIAKEDTENLTKQLKQQGFNYIIETKKVHKKAKNEGRPETAKKFTKSN
jgi:carbamoylphosphate synthase small subunit